MVAGDVDGEAPLHTPPQQQQQQQQQPEPPGGGMPAFLGRRAAKNNVSSPCFSWDSGSDGCGSCIHIHNPNCFARSTPPSEAKPGSVCAVCLGCLGCLRMPGMPGMGDGCDAAKPTAPTTEFALSCGHRFHVPCIARWLDHHTTCPCCGRIVAAITRLMLASTQHPLPSPSTTRDGGAEQQLRYASSASEWWLGLLGVGASDAEHLRRSTVQHRQHQQHQQHQYQPQPQPQPQPQQHQHQHQHQQHQQQTDWMSWMVTAALWVTIVAVCLQLV